MEQNKRALVLASVASMIDQFNMPNIRLLIELGYTVDVACNFIEGSTCSDEKVTALKQKLSQMGVECHQIDFARNILKVGQNLRAYRQTKKLIDQYKYSLIHSHSPIGGFLSRIASRKARVSGTKVVYTAHGFHFYKGAPKLNWLLFYPIEKLSSRWTDVLVTITHEDYEFAKKKMYAKEVAYIPGVGIDVSAFRVSESDVELRNAKRNELGFSDSDIVLLSVGELNKNKNHQIILRAITKSGNKNLHYVIAGRGVLKDYLNELADSLGIGSQLHLLGFRTDVKDLFKAADIFVHPSHREGLSVAIMEAMASSLPIISSCIRGSTDLVEDGKGGYLFDPNDVDSADAALSKMMAADNIQSFGIYNAKKAEGLDVGVVMKTMRSIYTLN